MRHWQFCGVGRTKVHDVISADSTVIDHDIPSPQSYGVPLENVRHVKIGFLSKKYSTFFTSNLFLPSVLASAPPAFADFTVALPFEGPGGPASGISTSAILGCR